MDKGTGVKLLATLGLFLLSGLLFAGGASAGEDGTERRLLRASAGLQMPGSEADSEWSFVSYEGVRKIPTADRMARIARCPAGMTHSDFDATFDRLGTVEPWMDRGQRKSARGFRRLGKLFHREYGDDLAAYRCETGGPEVPVYFVGVDEEKLSGLKTVNIET